jgi:predicted DNA-binding transcriptional regulator YafY
MRADRLLSILMLLQARGRMTAGQLAAELEVSQRTIYRDVDALSIAGVPIYSDRGRDGGYALLDSYRTSLTGLNEKEVRALFMLSIPSPLRDLGMGGELEAALRKLAAALPAARREDERRVRERFYLDATWWFQGGEPLPHLATVHRAVWEDRRLEIRYPVRAGHVFDVEQTVAPYGLVAKAGVWYLVYAYQGRVRALRVSNLLSVQVEEERFERPPGFELGAFWEAWCARVEQDRPVYTVRVRAAPHIASDPARYLGEGADRIVLTSPPLPDAGGWVTIEWAFEDLAQARSRLLALGGAVKVLEPLPLRRAMADYGRQITARYACDARRFINDETPVLQALTRE